MNTLVIRHHTPHSKFLIISALFILAFLERTVFDLGPNFELVTTVMVLASFYFGTKESFCLTFAIIAFSDRINGNSSIFLFTWSGFLIPALFINDFFKTISIKLPIKKSVHLPNFALKLTLLTSLGLFANLFFYIWTNFGVWLLDSFNMYPNTLRGLLMSYINGLPFLKYQIISTLLFLPLTKTIFSVLQNLFSSYKTSKNAFIISNQS
jgi:hypothetical protein